MKPAVVLSILAFTVPSMARAADAGDCRNLLTLDEVAAAVDDAAKLTNAGKRGDVGSGDERLQVCSWATDTYLAGVNVNVVPMLDAADIARGLTVVQYPLDERRRQRWSEQRQDFGGVHCSTLSPPKTDQREPFVTGCVGEVRGTALYVGVSNRKELPTFALAKRLFDKAAARL